jgi:hypothetical protein
LNSVPHWLLKIQSTPPHGRLAHISAHDSILLVSLPGVVETFKFALDEMTHRIDFKLVNLWHGENANVTQNDLNTRLDEPENQWNVHLVSYHTLTLRAKS